MSADAAILVVDDNEDNRYTLTRRLQREGYTHLAEAVDGTAALARLAEREFDLVLLDIMMPGMSGHEVLETMKADARLRGVPVIVVSALDDMDSVVRAIALGAEDYLPKPFNATLLRARISACLEKKRLRDREAAHLAAIERERARADELLNAILPPGAVAELKASGIVEPRRHEDVSVLFCDIVGFTRWCDQHPPEQVVTGLQTLVGAFEDIAESHGMEKIKTVGDAFIATGGLLRRVDDPIAGAARCGLEMAAVAAATEPYWQVRVGLHVGPVVAGIVGRRQFLFDLWGDTVNVAARIVAQAEPGRLVMSGNAWRRLDGRATGTSLGTVELKGKGPVEIFQCTTVSDNASKAG